MGSREKDQPTPHLSSLVVRPTDSGGENGGGGAGSDYEPGEVRRDAPPYSRSDRFSDTHGSSLYKFIKLHQTNLENQKRTFITTII